MASAEGANDFSNHETKRLADYDFGELAAESDKKLFDYFVVTPIAETVVKKNIGLVLGRKGSGKTALFRQAEELLGRFGRSNVSVIRLNMDDLAWAAFTDFKKLGLSVEHAATVAWQLALLLQLSAHIAAAPASRWSAAASRDAQILRAFVKDNFGEITPDLTKSSKLIGQVQSLKVGAFGASIESSFSKDASSRELAPALTEAISGHLVAPLKDSAWLIVLDQLDESWDGSDEKRELLVGLLKAVKRINDDFGWDDDPLRGVRAIAFLRTDIHDTLSFDDKDKHRGSRLEIKWTHEQLREMVQNRIGEDGLESLFESRTSQRKGRIPKGSFNYLASRTFMRPRDLIQFLIEIQNAFPDETVIGKRVVVDSEQTYSRDKVDDLGNEYRKAAPWVDPALSALKQGPNKFESRADLEAHLAKKISAEQLAGLAIGDVHNLVDWMIETSILGAALRKTATETIRFRCEGDSVSLEGDSTAWVHPGLFLGLALYEPRTSRAA
ncbi:P-loop ATPase, Sll1717 family [Agromyces sp. MMS24-K17]|uniref:P-loop ATPase, Sll1717 family n=1 Tax=Agromyces sp. MMS24-K17 TaxID=3372850 RepID=UPI003754E22E